MILERKGVNPMNEVQSVSHSKGKVITITLAVIIVLIIGYFWLTSTRIEVSRFGRSVIITKTELFGEKIRYNKGLQEGGAREELVIFSSSNESRLNLGLEYNPQKGGVQKLMIRIADGTPYMIQKREEGYTIRDSLLHQFLTGGRAEALIKKFLQDAETKLLQTRIRFTTSILEAESRAQKIRERTRERRMKRHPPQPPGKK
jgi:hypothetical protein